MKLITKEIATKLMAAYEHSAETGEGGKEVLAKFFTPWAGATWYVSEGWPVDLDGAALTTEAIEFEGLESMLLAGTDWHLFGFADLGDAEMAELGYVMLSDLEGLSGPFGLKVERDLAYSGALSEVLVKYGRKAA